eukprot:753556-Alexandrium_andersonii.AAC.1
MAPSRAMSSSAKPVSTGGAGEWKQAQSRSTARRTRQPLKSLCTDGSAVSGFAQLGAQSQPCP